MSKFLVTGSAGFLGQLLVSNLLEKGHSVVAVDLLPTQQLSPLHKPLQMDLTDGNAVAALVELGNYDSIFHLASQIDFGVRDQKKLLDNNVISTQCVAKVAANTSCRKVVFTSSNSIYLGYSGDRPITEKDIPKVTDAYGESKVLAEQLLTTYSSVFDSMIFRCPNIIDSGRVGMLSIFFDFVLESRKCWLIGEGNTRYQCIYAQDLIDAMLKSVSVLGSSIYNVGSDDVSSIREMYQAVIDRAGTGARVASVPRFPTIPFLRLLNRLKLSPIGPYQFRMLTGDFVFDCAKAKNELGWSPTLNNAEMLCLAFDYYVENRQLLETLGSANSRSVSQGAIRLLRKIS